MSPLFSTMLGLCCNGLILFAAVVVIIGTIKGIAQAASKK